MGSDNSSKAKKNRSGILLTDKVKIINDLEKGMSIRAVMQKYRIKARSTVYNIRRSKTKIKNNIENIQGNIGKHRKTFKQASYPKVDEALYNWFLQIRQQHIPVNQDMLILQAEKFFNELVNVGKFGSRGYIHKFIKRYGLRRLKITGEKLSCNMAIIDEYVNVFKTEMRSKDLLPSQIFNADESGLYFKCTPTHTYVDQASVSAPGKKVNRERLTFMPCANMDGSLKLPLLVIGKFLKPRPLKNVQELSVCYTVSKNAWMTRALFRTWFFEQFVPQVRTFLTEQNLPMRAVLVLDNCAAHFDAEDLKSDDGAIETMFLPPNSTAVIQPMDQNVIQMV